MRFSKIRSPAVALLSESSPRFPQRRLENAFGGWRRLKVVRGFWVAQPFGVWFFKGCGFRVNFILDRFEETLLAISPRLLTF
jgi:hypothetical protein